MSNLQSNDAKPATMPATPTPRAPREYITTRCGSATVTMPKPSEEEIQRNIAQSAGMLEGLLMRLLTPGVEIPERDDVPTFFVSSANRWRVFRKLHGKCEAGYFRDGKFQPEDHRP